MASNSHHKRFKVFIFIVLISLLLGCSGGLLSNENYFSTEYVRGQVIARFNDGISYESGQIVLKSYGLTLIDSLYPYSGSALVGVPLLREKYWAAVLSNDPNFKYAELNYIAYVEF